VTTENLDTAARELTNELPWQGWTLLDGPDVTTMGGLPAVRYALENKEAGLHSTVVYAFDDRTAYQLLCHSTTENEAEVDQGCEQIIRTLEVK
jgi:hypothetical protein